MTSRSLFALTRIVFFAVCQQITQISKYTRYPNHLGNGSHNGSVSTFNVKASFAPNQLPSSEAPHISSAYPFTIMKIGVETKHAAAKEAEQMTQMKTVGFLECFVSFCIPAGAIIFF